jgi:hypothetical protein
MDCGTPPGGPTESVEVAEAVRRGGRDAIAAAAMSAEGRRMHREIGIWRRGGDVRSDDGQVAGSLRKGRTFCRPG